MNRHFNPGKAEKLNNPVRLELINPGYIWHRLNIEQHEMKVEIGAGTGLFSRAFQNISGCGATVALDISSEMIDYMKKNVSVENPEISPRLVTGNSLPVEDSTADLVYMITVHHELDSPQAILNEARRILKEGGRIFIVDWNMNNLKMGPPAEIRYTAEKAAEQLKEAGFINVRIDPGFKNFFLVIADG